MIIGKLLLQSFYYFKSVLSVYVCEDELSYCYSVPNEKIAERYIIDTRPRPDR